MSNQFDRIVAGYISPVLVEYTKWVLAEAKRLGIEHLYFLARDGYQMYHIAKKLGSNMKCSYFYCSRYALRMAAYSFFDDCAYERLFIPAFKLTAQNMLERAGFNESERTAVYDEIGFNKNEKDVMGRAEFAQFCEAVRCSIIFNGILKEKSDAAYANTIEYIKHMGMDKYSRIGIVDLGWTGSLQYTLRRLLNTLNVRSELHGFYMGMLDAPPKTVNSFYYAWLFDENDYDTKAWFSHNLMECICSAPHGMTMGYVHSENQTEPILAVTENNAELSERINHITLRYAEKHKTEFAPETWGSIIKRLRRLMFSPTLAQANALSVYNFCDDVGEQYHRSIVAKVRNKEFFKEILPFKIFFADSADGLYWYYGTLAASGVPFKFGLKYSYFYTKRLLSLIRSR